MWGDLVNLSEIEDEDRQEIEGFCKQYNIDIKEFGNYLDAAHQNYKEYSLREKIKSAETEFHLERMDKIKNKSKKKQVVNQPKYTFEEITQALENFKQRRDKEKFELDFENRENINDVKKGWNHENIPKRALEGNKASLQFENLLDIQEYDMWNLTPEKRSESLTNHLENFIAKLKIEMGILSFSELGTTSNETVTIIGRVVNTDSEVKLEQNIELINLTEENENGLSKVKLSLGKDVKFAFFEGQIVIAEGISDKDIFNAEVIKELPLIMAPPKMKEGSLNDGFLSVMVFSGPFTFNDNLKYTPLKYIASLIKDQQPELVILGGPFVDIYHPQISEGELFFTDKEEKINCFEESAIYIAIRDYLDQTVDGLRTKIVIIPSLDDIHSQFPFPQPPLSDKNTDNVVFLSNPSRFCVNGVEFGVTNTEIVRGIIGNYYNTDSKKGRLQAAIEQLAKQRSFYPLYPPFEGVSIDINQHEKYQMDHLPDVFITISELPFFADAVEDKVVFVNPGQVTKKNKRGTYAFVTIDTTTNSEKLKDKVSVEIKSI